LKQDKYMEYLYRQRSSCSSNPGDVNREKLEFLPK
jgi:hypothetical protein